MPQTIETQAFGQGTPSRRIELEQRGPITRVTISIQQATNPVTVKFPPGTEIYFEGQGGFRPLEPEEIVFAKEITFFGEGMSTGRTLEDRFFKAMDDPLQITPLRVIEE